MWLISVKVITSPSAVSLSKVRPITSIFGCYHFREGKRGAISDQKPKHEENQPSTTDILFGQPVASTWWRLRCKVSRSLQSQYGLNNSGTCRKKPWWWSKGPKMCRNFTRTYNWVNVVDSGFLANPAGPAHHLVPGDSVIDSELWGRCIAHEMFHSNHNLTGYQHRRAQ